MPSLIDIATQQAQQRGMRTLDVAPPGSQQPPPQPGPPPGYDPEMDIDDQIEQANRQLAAQAKMAQLANAQSLIVLRQQAEIARLQKEISPPPPDSDAGIPSLMKMIMDGQRETTNMMVGAINGMRQEFANAQQNQVIAALKSMDERITQIQTGAGAPAQKGELDQLMDWGTRFKQVAGLLEEIRPTAAPPIDPGLTAQQRLAELGIITEGRIHEMRENRRYEEAKWAADKDRDERLMTADRFGQAISGFRDVAAPLVEGIARGGLGRLGGLLGAPEQNGHAAGNGAAPQLAAPQPFVSEPVGMSPHGPGVGEQLVAWQCPNQECLVTNYSPPGTADDVCTGCGNRWSLHPIEAGAGFVDT